jgi:transcriptional regulator with XRE-family HTH domain
MSIVSNNIKYLRKLSGLTQEQFASKIDIKRSLLGAYEEARANPNLANLENMASAFGISVDNLLRSDLKQSAEKQEISIPFKASSQMTVSHSGAGSSKRPLLTENQARLNPGTFPVHESPRQAGFPSFGAQSDPVLKDPEKIPEHKVREAKQNEADLAKIPVFNNRYTDDTTESLTSRAFPTIQLVSAQHQQEYLRHHQNPSFVASLPPFQLPNLPWEYYRAFESGNDFLYPGALLIGSFIRNWYDVRAGVDYIFVLRNAGIVYRKAINEVQQNGRFRLTSDLASIQQMYVTLSDVLEVWEVKAFVSSQLPAAMPSYAKIEQLVDEIQNELKRK